MKLFLHDGAVGIHPWAGIEDDGKNRGISQRLDYGGTYQRIDAAGETYTVDISQLNNHDSGSVQTESLPSVSALINDRTAELQNVIFNAMNIGQKEVWFEEGLFTIKNYVYIADRVDKPIGESDNFKFRCRTRALGGQSLISGALPIPAQGMRRLDSVLDGPSTNNFYNRIPSGSRSKVWVVELSQYGLTWGVPGITTERSDINPTYINAYWNNRRIPFAMEKKGGWRFNHGGVPTAWDNQGNPTNFSDQEFRTDEVLTPISSTVGVRAQTILLRDYFDVDAAVESLTSTTNSQGNPAVKVRFQTPLNPTVPLIGWDQLNWRRFNLYNAPEYLSVPNECVIDPTNNRVYVYPAYQNGVLSVNQPLPITTELVQARHCLNQEWDHVGVGNSFKVGLRIGASASDPSLEERNVSIHDADFTGNQGAAINLVGVRDVSITGCTFKNSESNAIKLSQAGQLLTNGLWNPNTLWPMPKNIRVLANEFSYLGLRSFDNSEALDCSGDTYANGVLFSGNYVNDLPGTAVYLRGMNNRVSNNTFQRCAKEVSETSAVYLGRSYTRGPNFIQGNLITDTTHWARRYPVPDLVTGAVVSTYPASKQITWGLYGCDNVSAILLDDGQSWVAIENNTIIKANVGGMANLGRGQIWRNNTFVSMEWRSIRKATLVPLSYFQPQMSELADFWRGLIANGSNFASAPWTTFSGAPAGLQELSSTWNGSTFDYLGQGWAFMYNNVPTCVSDIYMYHNNYILSENSENTITTSNPGYHAGTDYNFLSDAYTPK